MKAGEIHEWEALYRLAVKETALDASNVAGLQASSALETGEHALKLCGFRMYQALTVMLFDPKRLLAAHHPCIRR